MRIFVLVAFTAGLLIASAAWRSETLAQTPPKAPTGAPAPAAKVGDKAVQGAVKSVDSAKKTVTLQDGTTLMVSDAAKLKELKPGTMIKASYDERGDQKVASSIEVMKQK